MSTSAQKKAVDMETKYHAGHITEVKQEDRNGVPVGIIKGYIATWDVDRGDMWGTKDQFMRGAFQKSLAEHRANRQRQIRFKDHHGRTVGGFPIDGVFEDDVGLFGTAEVNLEVQQGKEAHSLARQGVLVDFSVGFSAIDDVTENGLRQIMEATIWEGSLVDEPMNQKAQVTEVKAVVPFQDLPMAEEDREWDSDAAIGRLREFTDSDEEPSATYRRAFLWYEREMDNEFGAYKLPIADVINGRLSAVPNAIFAAAAAMSGARGGVDIPDDERAGVIANIERYYEKMDRPSPFDGGGEAEGVDTDKQVHMVEEVKTWTRRDFEKALKASGKFTRGASKALAARFEELPPPVDENEPGGDTKDYSGVLEEIKKFSDSLNK